MDPIFLFQSYVKLPSFMNHTRIKGDQTINLSALIHDLKYKSHFKRGKLVSFRYKNKLKMVHWGCSTDFRRKVLHDGPFFQSFIFKCKTNDIHLVTLV